VNAGSTILSIGQLLFPSFVLFGIPFFVRPAGPLAVNAVAMIAARRIQRSMRVELMATTVP
jgi:TRAP-type C4-dicarboxylate transport system permease small subunit